MDSKLIKAVQPFVSNPQQGILRWSFTEDLHSPEHAKLQVQLLHVWSHFIMMATTANHQAPGNVGALNQFEPCYGFPDDTLLLLMGHLSEALEHQLHCLQDCQGILAKEPAGDVVLGLPMDTREDAAFGRVPDALQDFCKLVLLVVKAESFCPACV